MAAGLEVELKLRADDEAPLLHLATIERLGPYRLGPATEFAELDRYLDTADLRLSAVRWACRLRARQGAARVSLKGPPQHEPGAAVHRRPELEGPADGGLDPAGWPPSEARDELLRLTGRRPLVERLALRQLRTEREVTGERRVGVLSLDRVTVLHGGTERGRFLAVELELDPDAGNDGVADALLVELRAAVEGLSPDARSKLERALDLLPAPS